MDPYPGIVSFHVHDDIHHVLLKFVCFFFFNIEDAIESLYGSKF